MNNAAGALDPLEAVMRYHQETKHHFSRYARAPGTLDWANQPDPFRRYEGSALFALPVLKPDEAPRAPLYEALYGSGAIASAPVTVRSLSRLLEYSLAISAWKQAGEVRWALRTNPSSGNLHPTEGYLLIGEVPGLAPFPGLYHYAAREHALELRAELPQENATSLLRGFPPNAFLEHEPFPAVTEVGRAAAPSLPALACGGRCRPERDRGVELLRMEVPGFGSCLIAGKASEPPGAIKEPWGREAAARLADGDGRDEGAVGRRILRHEMLQCLGHLMNGVRGCQPQSLGKLPIGDRNALCGERLKIRSKPAGERFRRVVPNGRRRGEVLWR